MDKLYVLYEMVFALRHVVTLWTLDGPCPLVFPSQVGFVLGFVLRLEAANHTLRLLLVLMLPPHVLVIAVLSVKRPVALRALEGLQLGMRGRHVALQLPIAFAPEIAQGAQVDGAVIVL